MSGVNLYLLGPPKIEIDGIPVKVDTRKVMALLVYLAVMRESYRRDSLVNLLWPEYDPTHGRAVLRRTLSALSTTLPKGSLDTDRDTIRISPSLNLWIDVLEFRRLVAERRLHSHTDSEVCPDCQPLLTQAIDLYHADFMSGFSLSDSFNFDDWQFFQAESLRHEMENALGKLVNCLVLRADLDEALQTARRWLALDRLNEEAHCELMRLYSWTQQRSAALRQYQECKNILLSQLGVEPQKATTDLYHAIENGQFHPPPPIPSWQSASELGKSSPLSGQNVPPSNLLLDNLDSAGEIGVTHAEITSSPGFTIDRAFDGDHRVDVKRMVTALFFEVCRSVYPEKGIKSAKEDDLEESLQQFKGFLEHARPVLDQYGGHIEQQIGQNALILFGLSHAHENDPELALRAAVDLNRQAARSSLCIAAGITTGEIFIRYKDSHKAQPLDLTGDAIATSIFLASQAQAGEILAAESTYQLTRKTFKFTPYILPTRVRGALATVYKVERLLPLTQKTRGIEGLRSKIVGRNHELDELEKALSNARSRMGQLVAVMGEAGVGKSRLVEEFHQRVLAERESVNPLWLEGRCLELSMEVSYWPFTDLLKLFFNWQAQDSDPYNRAQISSSIQKLVSGDYLSFERGKDIEILINHLLLTGLEAGIVNPLANLTPDEIRQRTFLALRDFLLALSNQQPLVLVFEDMHWADHLSLDLVYFLMEGLDQGHILIVVVFRPEAEYRTQHLVAIAERKCRERFTEIHLRELSLQESYQMIDYLLGEEHLAGEIQTLIWERCQGNPFFIEEVIQSLINAGTIYQERGHWLVLTDFDAGHIPISIQSVILSRLDGLKEDWLQVLRAAAVIGRVFSKKVLRQALPMLVDMDKVLWEMEGHGLVYQERAIPDEEYSFRHVLMQEAVYHSILRQQRKILHQAVAEAIEKLYADHLEEYYEALAYHYEKSGNIHQTVDYLFKAGEKASLNFANETALNHFNRGLELLRSLPETPERQRQELSFLVAMGVTLVHSRGHADDQVLETYIRARNLCEELGDTIHLYDVLLGLRRFALTRGQTREALGYSQQMLELGISHADPVEQARAYMMQSESMYYLADFSHSIESGRKGGQLCRDQNPFTHIRQYGNDTRLGCEMFLPTALWLRGYTDQAQDELDNEHSLLAKVTHPFSRVMGLFFISTTYQLMRQPERVQTVVEELIQIANDHGYALYQELGLAQLGWALAAQGQLEVGIARLSQGIEGIHALNAIVFMTNALANLGEALTQSGQVPAGLDAIEEGLGISQETGIVHYLPELHRLKGEALLKEKDETGAEACFLKAIEIALSQQAHSWELRTTISLARLWQAQGRNGEAFDQVSRVYNWFTEGFNTPDLQDAKMLVDQLSL